MRLRLPSAILAVACLLRLGAAEGREVPVTILYTTDVHGHILPARTAAGGEAGGLLRCATRIEQERARAPDALLVDCGDAIQGSAESWRTRGRAMIRAMEWLKYDAWLLGNHDFDWGLAPLQKLHDQASLNILGGNIRCGTAAEPCLSRVKPFVVKEVDGIRIALVGITTPGIPQWLRPEILGDVRFEKSVPALSRIMAGVREARPDVMVLLVHQGYQAMGDDAANEVGRIARSFPEFDVILGGHLHKALPSAQLNGVLYSQAGYYANALGRVRLTYDTVKRAVTRKESELLPVDDLCAPSAALRDLLKEDLDATEAYLAEEVGETKREMDASVRLPAQSPIQQLLARSIAEAARADVVLHGVLSAESLPAGPIRCRDIWRIVPYENRIGVAWLTLQEIREILEENVEQSGSSHFLGAYGLSYELHPDAPRGRRVRQLSLADGTRPHPKKRLRVAMNSHALASGGGRFPRLRSVVDRPNARFELTNIDTRSAVFDYVRKHSPLDIAAGSTVTVVRGDR